MTTQRSSGLTVGDLIKIIFVVAVICLSVALYIALETRDVAECKALGGTLIQHHCLDIKELEVKK